MKKIHHVSALYIARCYRNASASLGLNNVAVSLTNLMSRFFTINVLISIIIDSMARSSFCLYYMDVYSQSKCLPGKSDCHQLARDR